MNVLNLGGATHVRQARALLVLAGLLSGCGPTAKPPLYYWGGYEQSIYTRYNKDDPPQVQAYLQEVIATGTTGGKGRVPPGVFADYGMLLYQQGRGAEAIQYFEKEAAAFPESAPLMTKLIARVGNGTAPGSQMQAPLSSTKDPKSPEVGSAGNGATEAGQADRGPKQATRGDGG